jgi:hypothetical protein
MQALPKPTYHFAAEFVEVGASRNPKELNRASGGVLGRKSNGLQVSLGLVNVHKYLRLGNLCKELGSRYSCAY